MRVMPIEFCGLNQTHDGSCPFSRPQAAGEEPVGASDGNLGVILPMSGKKWKSFTAGMHSSVVVFEGNTASTERPATWFTSRLNPA